MNRVHDLQAIPNNLSGDTLITVEVGRVRELIDLCNEVAATSQDKRAQLATLRAERDELLKLTLRSREAINDLIIQSGRLSNAFEDGDDKISDWVYVNGGLVKNAQQRPQTYRDLIDGAMGEGFSVYDDINTFIASAEKGDG